MIDIERSFKPQFFSTLLKYVTIPAAVAAVVEKHIVVAELPRRDVVAADVDLLLPVGLPVELRVLVLGPVERLALSPAPGAVAEHRS